MELLKQSFSYKGGKKGNWVIEKDVKMEMNLIPNNPLNTNRSLIEEKQNIQIHKQTNKQIIYPSIMIIKYF